MGRVRISDLEVTDRDLYIGYRIDAHPRYDEAPTVLHIIDRQGISQTRKRFGFGLVYEITRCNHAMDSPNHFKDEEIPGANSSKFLDYKLCARCGTQEDFELALAEYHGWLKEHRARLRAKLEEKEAEEERKRIETEEIIREFLAGHGIAVVRWSGTTAIVHSGEHQFGVSLEKK